MTSPPPTDPPGFPGGHFYSPIPDFSELARRRTALWPANPALPPGLDFRPASQRRLLERVAARAPRYPYATGATAEDGRLFRDDNPHFSGLDARLYHALLHLWRPRRLVEVGSGFSTLLLLDARAAEPRIAPQLTVIDPFPGDEVRAALANAPGARLIVRPVQEAGEAPFAGLGPGDILFIDSSHVVKTGSDVQFLLLDVLPRLRRGVRIHVHDIFLPGEYPAEWVLKLGRAWNEQYVVQAMLQSSRTLRVVAASAFLHAEQPGAVERTFGEPVSGGSLWLERIGPVAPFPTAARPSQRKLRWLAIALGFLLAEILARALVMSPQAPPLHRIDYARPGAPIHERRAMTSAWAWWSSTPDRAAFPRWLGRHGFRGSDWSARPPRGVERFLVLGDSFVEGLGAPDGATISESLAAALGRSGRRIEALNLGVAGGGFPEYLPLLRDALLRLHPAEVVLVIYDNDFGVPLPDPEAALARIPPPPEPVARFPLPRLVDLATILASGADVPWRFRPAPSATPRPLDVTGRLLDDPRLRERVDAVGRRDLRAAMLAGRLSPVVVDHLDRSVRGLPLPIHPEAVLAMALELSSRSGALLRVAYLPTLNQVSDAYLDAQRAISPSLSSLPDSLQTPPFQRHARDLERATASLGIPFLDLTPACAEAEGAGLRLYWGFDGHMRANGYRVVGDALASWYLRAAAERSDRGHGAAAAEHGTTPGARATSIRSLRRSRTVKTVLELAQGPVTASPAGPPVAKTLPSAPTSIAIGPPAPLQRTLTIPNPPGSQSGRGSGSNQIRTAPAAGGRLPPR